MRLFILLLWLIISGNLLVAQDAVPNCTSPKTIKVPFVSNNDKIEQIYYQLADEYTYWYQIIPEVDCVLEYSMTIIDESDAYEFLAYQPISDRFCNDLVTNKIKPISFAKSGNLSLKKGKTYLFSVVYLDGDGCGHNLSLTVGENNLKIKAIQNRCVEQVMEELVVSEIIAELDTVISVETELAINDTPLKIDRFVKGQVVNNKTQENIEAIVIVHNSKDAQKQQIYSGLDSGFVLKNFIEKEIVVSVKKFGYQMYYDTLNVASGSFKIELSPIAVGEIIVMNKIYFHPNTYVLKQESKQELNKLLDFMLENKGYSFEIQGHTSGNRTVKKTKKYAHMGEEWNFKGTSKKLSKLRAEKIKGFLIKNGVAENKLQTVGYGGDRMIVAKPKNMIQAMKNIRVELIVLQ